MHRIIVVALFAKLAAGQGCDPQLLKQINLKDEDRYRQRGERCEGVYLEPVSGDTGRIWVASLTTGAAVTKWPPGSLPLQWSKYQNAAVTVQAYSLRPRLYYRVDSSRPAGTYQFAWPTDLVARYLTPAELGLVAFTSATLEGRPVQVYLPLGVGGRPAAPYQLKMVSTADLSSVSVLVSGPDGKPVQPRKSLAVGTLLRGQPFSVPLPTLGAAGLYRVSVIGQAARMAGSVNSPVVYFYHGAP